MGHIVHRCTSPFVRRPPSSPPKASPAPSFAAAVRSDPDYGWAREELLRLLAMEPAEFDAERVSWVGNNCNGGSCQRRLVAGLAGCQRPQHTPTRLMAMHADTVNYLCAFRLLRNAWPRC